MVETKLVKEFEICFVFDENAISQEDAERAVVNGLCDAGNAIIGDNLDGLGTKIEYVDVG